MCMHVHMNVGTCVHASVNACVSMYLEARVRGRCIIPSLSILYFEAGSLLYPELTDLSNQLVFFFFSGIPCLCILCSGIQDRLQQLFSMCKGLGTWTPTSLLQHKWFTHWTQPPVLFFIEDRIMDRWLPVTSFHKVPHLRGGPPELTWGCCQGLSALIGTEHDRHEPW